MRNSDRYQYIKVEHPLLHFKLIGFWDDKEATGISEDFIEDWKQAIAKMKGKPFISIADLTEFKPHSPGAQALITKGMKYAVEHKLMKTIQILPTALHRLGVKSAASKVEKNDFRIIVGSKEEAYEMYSKLKMEL